MTRAPSRWNACAMCHAALHLFATPKTIAVLFSSSILTQPPAPSPLPGLVLIPHRAEDIQRPRWPPYRRRAVLGVRGDQVDVTRMDEARLIADHQLERPCKAHPHLLVHVMMPRHRGAFRREIEERHHDPITPR